MKAEPFNPKLGGGFKYFFTFTPIWGKIPILTNMFQRGWLNHQLENLPKDLGRMQIQSSGFDKVEDGRTEICQMLPSSRHPKGTCFIA